MNKITIITLYLLFLNSCNFPEYYFSKTPECKPVDQIACSGNPLSQENQKLIIEIIRNKDPKDYRYFFKTFIDEGNNTFMVTNFRNNDTCFDVKILADKWDKLGGMRKANGVSYPNELYDLKWKIRKVLDREEVVYVDMHRIID